MKHGSEWYKREPAAYLGGVQGMTAKEHAVYSVTLDLIYQHGGSVNNDPSWIAGWIKDMGASAVRKSIQVLVDRRKLIIEGDQITQNRAKTEAKTKENLRETARENGKKGGEKSAEKRAVLSKNNDLDEPVATSEIQAEKTREDKSKVEPKGSCEITTPAAIDEVAQAIQHFNATASQASWPTVQKTSATRRSALKARIKDVGGLEAWCEAITRASTSPHLTGQNNRGWTATFDWLANPANFTKLMEGNYDERTHKPATQPNWRDQTLADEIANAARAR